MLDLAIGGYIWVCADCLADFDEPAEEVRCFVCGRTYEQWHTDAWAPILAQEKAVRYTAVQKSQPSTTTTP